MLRTRNVVPPQPGKRASYLAIGTGLAPVRQMLGAIKRRLNLDPKDARALVERVFRDHHAHNFAVCLWDGQRISWNSKSHFTLTFVDPETFRQCFGTQDPAQFAEAYIDGRLIIEGDLWAAIDLGDWMRQTTVGLRERLKFGPKLAIPASRHSFEHDRRDVQAHYDLSDAFFSLFLDEKMVYSCAYFATPDQNLERAQERKLDLICKKLDLQPGDAFIDVGCGWGALLIWAAKHYGVRGHGITLSDNQVREARRRVETAGLNDRVSIELGHYADLPANRYDKVASIGMYEHVGLEKLPAYLHTIHRSLRPRGLFLNHGISVRANFPGNTGAEFIFRNVFPGAELATVSRIQTAMERVGFEILDVQALRRHYALTLRAWYERFRARRKEAARLVPSKLLRIWDLYLTGTSRAFEAGLIGVNQVLVAKTGDDGKTRGPLIVGR